MAAFMPIALQRPAAGTYRIAVFLLGLVLAGYGLLSLVYQRDYFFGLLWVAVGAFFLTLPILAIRNAVRRLVVASAKRLAESHEVMTISSSGIDTKSDNASAHFDWAALAMARRVPG